MSIRTWRSRVGGVALLLGALLLAGCATSATAVSAPTATPTSTATPSTSVNHIVTIPNNDIFAPYISVINAGDTVTWVNSDTVLHTVVTTATSGGDTINPIQFQLVLPAGKQAGVLLRSPGLYYYYCGAHAGLTSQGRAAAFTTVRAYPVAMDGFIYVRGPGLSGLSSATINLSSDNQFNPWIVIVNSGASVTWVNQTAQPTSVRSSASYGLVDPVPLDFALAPGASKSMAMSTPGVYDYYSTATARLDPVWARPSAMSGAAGYPVPAEGIIVVLG
jgi:plastocyanin